MFKSKKSFVMILFLIVASLLAVTACGTSAANRVAAPTVGSTAAPAQAVGTATPEVMTTPTKVAGAAPTKVAGATPAKVAAGATPTKAAAKATPTTKAGVTPASVKPTPAAAKQPAQTTGLTLQLAKNPTLGQILTDNKGMTLYTYKNDKPGQSTCVDACAQTWPPLVVKQGEKPALPSGLNGKVGTIERPDGTYQVTFNDMPLYHFAQDTKPGDANGQGVKDVWSVVTPAEASSGTAGNTTASGKEASSTAGNTTTSGKEASSTASNTTASGKIALLLPETKTTRYESADRPYFEQKFKELCPNCEIIYSNANQDANAQLSQAEAALTNGAQVLVLDPVDSAAAAVIADRAKAQGVPVIAYDRLILNSNGVDYYISFDNKKVGELQAQSLVDDLNKMNIKNPHIVMINGSPTDNNAKLFKEGAHSVFDPLVKAKKLTIDKEYDTPDWSPDQAQNEMQQALTALGNKVDGVYAANDGTASGAIAAMKAASLKPIPPVTGQDAELAAIQRILDGEQYMTVYKAIKPEAEAAAQLAYDLLTKAQVPANMTNSQTVNNSKMDVPSVLLTPVAVTKDNIKETVVQDGFWTTQQICTSAYAQACQADNLK